MLKLSAYERWRRDFLRGLETLQLHKQLALRQMLAAGVRSHYIDIDIVRNRLSHGVPLRVAHDELKQMVDIMATHLEEEETNVG